MGAPRRVLSRQGRWEMRLVLNKIVIVITTPSALAVWCALFFRSWAKQGGFAALLAERLCLSVLTQTPIAATPLRRSLENRSARGKPKAFRKESGRAAYQFASSWTLWRIA